MLPSTTAILHHWHSFFPSLGTTGWPWLGGDILHVQAKTNRRSNLGMCPQGSLQQLQAPKFLLNSMSLLCSPPPCFQFPKHTDWLQRCSVPDLNYQPLGDIDFAGLLYLSTHKKHSFHFSALNVSAMDNFTQSAMWQHLDKPPGQALLVSIAHLSHYHWGGS